MKKIILILTFIFIMPAFALCPAGESVCTISGSDMPLFQNQYNVKTNWEENKNKSLNSLNSSGMDDSFKRLQNQNGIKMHGSLGCQFGNCNSENNNDFLPNQ